MTLTCKAVLYLYETFTSFVSGAKLLCFVLRKYLLENIQYTNFDILINTKLEEIYMIKMLDKHLRKVSDCSRCF